MKTKQLFSLSLAGFLAINGFFQTNLIAGHSSSSKETDSSVQTYSTKDSKTNSDGTTIQINQDGTKVIKTKNNTTIEIKPDGTKIIKKPGGVMIQKNPDGSKLITKPDGSSVQINSDGSKLIRKADGTIKEVKPDS